MVLCQQNRMDPLLAQNVQGLEIGHWMKPLANMIKVNVDGAIFEAAGCFGFGFMVRDSAGQIVEVVSKCRPGHVSSEIFEASGIKEALSCIKRKGWEVVTLETDCLVAVQAVKSNILMPSAFGLLVWKCRNLLLELTNVNFNFVKRSANKVAHFLQCSACYLLDCVFYFNDPPSELLDVVLAESSF
ncbi:uncharacterized protein LOC115696346 [Cannabis sativa]|uniref:RNase H type-1 domain-containing protein n=1 Tax=Cannabis sativa TaxID=3483 RepID=A0A803QGE7_CANSA|nr:uncharacterized protein LOC115696346 [Cannabis sativa]